MYIFGGEGLHSFSFAFLVGVVVGTYSSVYIASPVLLWMDDLWQKFFSGSSASASKAPRGRLSEAAR
jgi:preprotein translocase subunit SecF